jgi:hypothetical protein
LREPQSIIKKQYHDGSWKYPSKQDHSKEENLDQYQTFKNLGALVERFGFDKSHPAIKKTAEYFFSVQTDEGDFRGIYDKQYTPNYTAAIAELLIKSGYENDPRIERFLTGFSPHVSKTAAGRCRSGHRAITSM